MIMYDPKNWYRLIFSLRGTVVARVCRRVTLYGSLAFALWVCHAHALELPPVDPLGHSLLGVALGLLIVFRTNTSYDRCWEGRKLWAGVICAARNLIRGAAVYGNEAGELVCLVVAYSHALKQQLRGSRELRQVELLVRPEVFRQVSAAGNPPSVLAYYLSAWIRDRMQEGAIDASTARALESFVCAMADSAGGCERIASTPIPYAYAVHIKQMLALYLATLPFVLVPKMGLVAVFAVASITFGLVGIEEAGVEIENPFGSEANDLPLEEFCGTIAEDAQALAGLSERLRRAA